MSPTKTMPRKASSLMKAPARRKTYHVRALSHGDLWVVDVPEVPAARVRARRLDQVSEVVRETISEALHVSPDSFDVSVIAQLEDENLAARIEAARTLREEAEAARRAASEAMTEAARSLATRGFRIRDIGQLLGVSFQRASQLVAGTNSRA